ncbi:MAG: hypothetical protein R6V07_02180 [Armatimonadota bacterium]
MGRQATSQMQSRSTPRMSPARRVWSDIIWPALVIGMIGAGAVVYLFACARISIIECDLRRLDRARQAQQSAEYELQQQLAVLQNAERIQDHIVERELDRPRGTTHVRLTDLPPELYEALPTAGSDRERREIVLGQLAVGPGVPLHANGRQIASAQVQ